MQVLHPNTANAGVMLMGDFNHFECKPLCRHASLKHIIKTPTRGSAILDLMMTNLKAWYNEPEVLPALGLSDHHSILTTPSQQPHRPNKLKKTVVRQRKPSAVAAFGRFLTDIN